MLEVVECDARGERSFCFVVEERGGGSKQRKLIFGGRKNEGTSDVVG